YVAPGDTLTKELDVENTTMVASVLAITGAQMEMGSDPAFHVTSTFPLFSNHNAPAKVNVRFAPPLAQSSARVFNGTVHLATNDGAHPDIAVKLIGTARENPQLVLEPEVQVLDVGSVGGGKRLVAVGYILNV